MVLRRIRHLAILAPAQAAAGLAASLGAALMLASCGGQGPVSLVTSLAEGDPTKPYIGMTLAEITACAGMPHSRYDAGDSEVLTYHYSGEGPVPTKPADDKKSDKNNDNDKNKPSLFSVKKKDEQDWDCTASFVFQNDHLVRIDYAHKDVRSPYQWQSVRDQKAAEQMREQGVPTCHFSLPNCHR
jgi:hypothetical protein